MPAGVLPPNEEQYSMLVNNNGFTADMKGNPEHPTPKYTKVGGRVWECHPWTLMWSMVCGGTTSCLPRTCWATTSISRNPLVIVDTHQLQN
uniref:Uncharacterized protein n=1 Tax=Urocitellus parryii TaxID=9999 RepID=A0A8D2GNU5_UROPR